MSGQITFMVQKEGMPVNNYKLTGKTVVGSDRSADIHINDPLISPKHACVFKERSWWIIEDLSSENGTFVNENLIKKAPLFPDCKILMGNTYCKVIYSDNPQIETAIVKNSGEWVQLPRIIAHELKNYLQFFDAGLEQLKQDSKLIDRYSGQIKSLEMAGENMDELVQMLRAGCVKPRFEKINLNEVVWESIALVETMAHRQQINLITQIPDQPVIIVADANQIGRAVLNFLKNALEATPDYGYITVSVTVPSTHTAGICIKDTGHGMDKETLESFWTPLYTTRSNGNGLGAFIAKTAIVRHNGMVRADSALKQGTEIYIELPRTQKIV